MRLLRAGALDLQATEMALREGMHRVGSWILEKLLELEGLLHRCTSINIRGDSYRLKEKRKANNTSFLKPTEQEVKS